MKRLLGVCSALLLITGAISILLVFSLIDHFRNHANAVTSDLLNQITQNLSSVDVDLEQVRNELLKQNQTVRPIRVVTWGDSGSSPIRSFPPIGPPQEHFYRIQREEGKVFWVQGAPEDTLLGVRKVNGGWIGVQAQSRSLHTLLTKSVWVMGLQAAAGIVLILIATYLLFRAFLPISRLEREVGKASASFPHLASGGGVVAMFQSTIKELKTQKDELETLHRQEKTRAKEATVQMEAMIRQLNVGVMNFGEKGALLWANPLAWAALHQEGLRPEAKGKADHLLPQPLGGTVQDLCESGDQTISLQFTVDDRTIAATAIPQILSPTARRVLVLLVDRTEASRMETALQHQEELARLGELSAGLAHELRNGLASLMTAVKLEAKDKDLDRVRHSVAHLQKITDSFLTFARHKKPLRDRFTMKVLLGESIEEVRPSDTIRIEQEGIFPPLIVDPILIQSALENILRNAIEALENTADPLIRIRGVENKDSYDLYVADNGPGIPAGDRDKMLQPFQTRKEDGIGMGLALARKAILLHDGELFLEETKGGGLTAHIQIPR